MPTKNPTVKQNHGVAGCFSTFFNDGCKLPVNQSRRTPYRYPKNKKARAKKATGSRKTHLTGLSTFISRSKLPINHRVSPQYQHLELCQVFIDECDSADGCLDALKK
jgi:hypothetical protein